MLILNGWPAIAAGSKTKQAQRRGVNTARAAGIKSKQMNRRGVQTARARINTHGIIHVHGIQLAVAAGGKPIGIHRTTGRTVDGMN